MHNTFSRFLAAIAGALLIVMLLLTRACQKITRLSLFSPGNRVIHVDTRSQRQRCDPFNSSYHPVYYNRMVVMQCLSIAGILNGIANFKLAAISLWSTGWKVVSTEQALATREANARRRYSS